MDYLYDMKQMNHYYNNNYKNMEYMDLVPFSYLKDISSGKKVYLRDRIMPKPINKKKKKISNDFGINLNNIYGFYNNNIENPSQINNNNMIQRGNPNSNLNPNYFHTSKHFYTNIHRSTEIPHPYENQVQKNKPFKYQRMYQKESNNNNPKNRNVNTINQDKKKGKTTLTKNLHMNNKVDKYKLNPPNTFGQNNQFNPNNPIFMQPNIRMHAKVIVKNNISNNVNYPKYNYSNNNEEKNLKQKRMNKKIINKPIENDDNDEDDNLSNLAEDLINIYEKENKKISSSSKPKKNPENENNNENINKNKIDEYNIIVNKSIEIKEIKSSAEFGCQAEIDENNENNQPKILYNLNMPNKKENENDNENEKPKKVDQGIDMQQSLLPFLPEWYNNLNKNQDKIKNIGDKKESENGNIENNPVSSNKDSYNNNINQISEKKYNEIEEDDNENEDKDLNRLTNSVVKVEEKIINADQPLKIDDDFELGKEFIESDDVFKSKRLKIKEDKNIYFEFLKDDIINACQVKTGKFGDLKPFEPKKEEDVFNSRIVFNYKPSIKKFDKNEIKIDKDYKSRENMDEREILPDFYDDEEKGEIIEEAINELAESLRSSIDKTTNNLTNESLRSSINYSYNQSMRTSLMTSNNNEGQGIINKLKAAFEASLNHEL